ncbi:hypothetical protein [Streptomyces murinus]|uniref:hypothetical protein n=1 Tax=Streptomyces murinus TaxID=33900 RepID=UPI003D686BB4
MTNTDGNEHGMAQDRIALLLADAAQEIETGPAPVAAVVRGGRRRRARRWAATAVAPRWWRGHGGGGAGAARP